nr:10931_t:CDS:2 [Entrophospora candida]
MQQPQQQRSIHPVQKVASTSNDNGKVFTQFKGNSSSSKLSSNSSKPVAS